MLGVSLDEPRTVLRIKPSSPAAADPAVHARKVQPAPAPAGAPAAQAPASQWEEIFPVKGSRGGARLGVTLGKGVLRLNRP
ncbi:MAG: hypothetical protein ACP5NP_18040, partial [Acetobacteraceae bacterium]